MSGKTERATYKVYVGNLGNNGSKKELEREFERFEKLHDVWVARNPPGFAFVEFVEYRDAEDACRSLDGARNYILCLSILHIDHFVHLQKVIFTVIQTGLNILLTACTKIYLIVLLNLGQK